MSNNVATTVNPVEAFKTRVIDRIKSDIGDLMPDDVFQALVQQAVQELFFDPVKVKNPNYTGYYSSSGSNPEYILGPSWFQAEVEKAIQPVLEKIVEREVQARTEVIKKAVAETLTAQTLALQVQLQVGIMAAQGIKDGMKDLLMQMRNEGLLNR